MGQGMDGLGRWEAGAGMGMLVGGMGERRGGAAGGWAAGAYGRWGAVLGHRGVADGMLRHTGRAL
jgi:hypothetical protein